MTKYKEELHAYFAAQEAQYLATDEGFRRLLDRRRKFRGLQKAARKAGWLQAISTAAAVAIVLFSFALHENYPSALNRVLMRQEAQSVVRSGLESYVEIQRSVIQSAFGSKEL